MRTILVLLLGAALAAPLGLVHATAPLVPVSHSTEVLRDDIAASDRLFATLATLPGNGLTRGVALAAQATTMQLALAGFRPAASAALPPMAPSAAAFAILAASGVSPTADQRAALLSLDQAPATDRSVMAEFLGAFLAYETATTQAYDAADASALAEWAAHPRELLAAQPFGTDAAARIQQAIGLDLVPALAARSHLLQASLALRGVIGSLVAAGVPAHLDAAPALGWDFEGVPSTWSQDLRLLIDVGGDDVYLNNGGGSGLAGAAALWDFSGNDQYIGNRHSGANGGGFAGLGLLVDEAGDDLYVAQDDGTNGGGYLGAGLLLDSAGDDRYQATGWGANGGGYPGGLGMLIDEEGNDAYDGWFEAVNGGSFGGAGLLLDGAGNDAYTATFFGTNGGAVGGRGMLLDGAGDDTYVAQDGSVNGGALAGTGLLRDRAGRDAYEDNDGGSGLDRTVFPKGAAGAQVDQ